MNARITGKAASDVVVFTGNGVTASIAKVIRSMGLHLPIPNTLNDNNTYVPVVFTSSYEHHSNLLSWRETIAEVITIDYHPVTGVCLYDLHTKCCQYAHRVCKIGAFSACSNVTGGQLSLLLVYYVL